jgi:hypothetical protein
MDCDQAEISFSVEPDRCNLRLAGSLAVAKAEEVGRAAWEPRDYDKDAAVDRSGVTQLDAAAQVLLSLGAGLCGHKRSLMRTAGLPGIPAAPGQCV